MIFGIKKRADLLGIIAAFFFIIGSLNALEYFFAGKDHLAKYTGVVADVTHETFMSGSGKNRDLYTRTVISLKEYKRKFRLKDRSDEGGHVPVEKGDTVRLYVKRWYQNLYIFTFGTDIYYVERNGELIYNNLGTWNGAAFGIMCFAGGLAFFLFLIWLDQSKNISLEVWFQRKVLMKKNYRK